jgi:hypothetical protein
MKYISTQYITNVNQLSSLKPGQWFALESGQRGQYLGTTSKGVQVVRYQPDTFGKKRDTQGNKILRQYAKSYGAK